MSQAQDAINEWVANKYGATIIINEGIPHYLYDGFRVECEAEMYHIHFLDVPVWSEMSLEAALYQVKNRGDYVAY